MGNATQDYRWPRALPRRLTGAVALAMLFVAHIACAVTLNPHGVGQALIYPYYTVNKNQDTLVSITNASDVGKAIQVRLREGYDGRDALSFVLFLGAHDTWTASLSQTTDVDGARLNTSDTSCMSPMMPPGGVDLRSSAYDGTGVLPADGGPPDIWRTREGLIEFIVGGDIVPGSATDLAIAPPAAGGVRKCSADNFANFVDDLDDPSSGVYGSASIVNVGQGTFYGYNADAVQGLSDDVMFLRGNPYPGPSLADASTNNGVDGSARAYVNISDGHVLALDYHRGIDAVSAVFMADAVYNEYIVAESLGAHTDWVVTFPTKQFYVDGLYGAVPRAPFENAFDASGTADVEVFGSVFNREQGVATFGESCDGCGPEPPSALFYEVNVIGVGQPSDDLTSAVLGSRVDTLFMPPVGDAGNAVLHFTSSGTAPSLPGGIDEENREELILRGLPVTGFMAYNIVNANAQAGMLANYSGAFPHRTTVACDRNIIGCKPIASGADEPVH